MAHANKSHWCFFILHWLLGNCQPGTQARQRTTTIAVNCGCCPSTITKAQDGKKVVVWRETKGCHLVSFSSVQGMCVCICVHVYVCACVRVCHITTAIYISRLTIPCIIGKWCIKVYSWNLYTVTMLTSWFITSNLNESCKRYLRPSDLANTPLPRRLTGLFWTHIPKTGTSFGTTVYKFACPRLPDSVSVPSSSSLTSSQRYYNLTGHAYHTMHMPVHLHICCTSHVSMCTPPFLWNNLAHNH